MLIAVFSSGAILLEEVTPALLKCLIRPGGDTPSKKKERLSNKAWRRVCAKQPSKYEDCLYSVWYDGVKHREYLQISADQYCALVNLHNNIVFFCSRCVNHFPVALIEYDKLSLS